MIDVLPTILDLVGLGLELQSVFTSTLSENPVMEVSPRRFRALVAEAIDTLPSDWQEMVAHVVLLVEEVASAEDLSRVGMLPEEGHDLLGMYVGIPLTERSAFDAGLPDRIMIYRLPILGMCRSREDVLREVQHTVLHELGHHFGLGEDDLPF